MYPFVSPLSSGAVIMTVDLFQVTINPVNSSHLQTRYGAGGLAGNTAIYYSKFDRIAKSSSAPVSLESNILVYTTDSSD